jgi:predicted nucleotidyltransferase
VVNILVLGLGMKEMLTIDEIREKSKSVFMMYPVNRVALFGSYAKGLQTEDSDIDLLIKDSDIGILTASTIRQQLLSVFAKNVDLVSEEDLSDVFKFLIKDEEVIIYEK